MLTKKVLPRQNSKVNAYEVSFSKEKLLGGNQ
jgi:hypothetical protein